MIARARTRHSRRHAAFLSPHLSGVSATSMMTASPDRGTPMNPFALVTPYPYVGVPDPTLQAELTKAMTLKANTDRLGDDPHVPFSMIALATDGKHRYAGVLDAEMDFSSSLLKV